VLPLYICKIFVLDFMISLHKSPPGRRPGIAALDQSRNRPFPQVHDCLKIDIEVIT
jgi:hypothetical protein